VKGNPMPKALKTQSEFAELMMREARSSGKCADLHSVLSLGRLREAIPIGILRRRRRDDRQSARTSFRRLLAVFNASLTFRVIEQNWLRQDRAFLQHDGRKIPP
jgi:hypothetical protein